MRRTLENRLDDGRIDYRCRALLCSLVLGDRRMVTYSLKEAYQYLGMAHMLALSGLHLGILVLPLMRLSGFVPLNESIKGFLILSILFLYLAVAAFPPSLVRAYLLFGFFVVTRRIGVSCSLYRSLLLSGLTIMFISPATVRNPGYELSFLAVLGISTIGVPAAGCLETLLPGIFRWRCLRWVLYSVLITLSVQITTLPLALHLFGRVSGVSIPVNLVFILPLTVFLYAGATYTFAGTGPLKLVLSYPVNALARFLWELPLYVASSRSFGILSGRIRHGPYLLFVLSTMLFFRARGRVRLLLSMAAVFSLAVSLTAWNRGGEDEYALYREEHLSSCGSTLVSCGDGSILFVNRLSNLKETSSLVRELWKRGIGEIEALVFEGSSRVKYAGYFASRMGVKRFICTPYLLSGNPWVVGVLEGKGCSSLCCVEGDVVDVGFGRIVVESPRYPPPQGGLMKERDTHLKAYIDLTEGSF